MDVITYEQFRQIPLANQPAKYRPRWEEHFAAQTMTVATRSACLRRSVGAVIVKDCQILSTGYNGPPAGFDHASEVGCYRDVAQVPSGERTELCRGLHAEQNALLLAAKKGISVAGAELYCTHSPCITCQKMIIASGITVVKYFYEYADSDLISAEAKAKGILSFEKIIQTPFLLQLADLLNGNFHITIT